MRKISIFILITALLLTSCACSSSSHTYSANIYGTEYAINPESRTITSGSSIYKYSYSGSKLTITYPNGATWWHEIKDPDADFNATSGGWSDDYDESRYASGDALMELLIHFEIIPPPSKNIFAIILLLALGAFLLIAPYWVWYIGYGWRFKNAEPSDLALGLNRACGVILLIIAVVMIF